MADKTSRLDRLVANQANHFELANALHDAASPAMLFARDEASSGPNAWGVYGGVVLSRGVMEVVPNQSVLTLPSVAGEWRIEAGLVESDAYAITEITQADAAGVTAPGHPFLSGDHVYISAAVGGMTPIRQAFARVMSVAGDTVSVDWDTNGFPAYTSGGTIQRVGVQGSMKVGKARGGWHGPCMPCYVLTMSTSGIADWQDVRTNRPPADTWMEYAVPDDDSGWLDGLAAGGGLVALVGTTTAAREVQMPSGRGLWYFLNQTGNDVILVRGAASVTIANGVLALVVVIAGTGIYLAELAVP